MTTPREPETGPDPLQFDRAERVGATAAGMMTCGGCNAPIGTAYFEAAGKVLCPRCAAAVRVAAENKGRFGRAVLFGLGGAILGTAIYYAVLAVTGYEIGLIAILVGFIVGKAVSLGGGSFGGRRYQLLAVVLTYLSIGATFIPIVVGQLGAKRQAPDAAVSGAADSLSPSVAPAALDETGAQQIKPQAFIAGALTLVVLAATMPVLVGVSNLPASLISLLIMGFALMQAWRMNQRTPLEVSGPFTVPGAAEASGPALPNG